MKFFAQIDDKIVQVQVARPPKNPDSLTNFKRTNGSTYTGTSDQFIGLKKGSKPGFYIAVSVKAEFSTMIIADATIEVDEELALNDTEDSSAEELAAEEPVVDNTPALSFTDTAEECCENEVDFRKFTFDFDFGRVNPENRNEAWVRYVNDKRVWITQFGSEHLKLANEMGCKCDNKYVVERVLRDFPAFHIYEEYPVHEMDTPDISFLLFLRNQAFTVKQKQVFQKFNSRVCLGWHFDDEVRNPAETEVIVQGFLGMCDLVCVFKDLLLHVEQPDQRM